MPQSTADTWHGFTSFFALLKATVSLGTMLGGVLWLILTLALDGRYAPYALADSVKANNEIANAVGAKVSQVQTTLEAVQSSLLLSQLFDVKLKSCASAAGDSRNFYVQRLQELRVKYRSLTGADPALPSCRELL